MKKLIRKRYIQVIIIMIIFVGIAFLIYKNLTRYNLSEIEELRLHNGKYNLEQLQKYTVNGEQTTLSEDDIAIVEANITEESNIIKMINKVYNWEKEYFKYERAGGAFVGKRTVSDIFDDKILTGCHDYGIVFSSILRHYGISAVMVDTAGIKWANKYQNEKTRDFSGHVFVEIYYEDSCFLFDPTFGKLIIDYDPNNPIIPTTFYILDSEGFYVIAKGIDPLDYGVSSIDILKKRMIEFAQEIQEIDIVIPKYKVASINNIDFNK